MFKQFTKNSLHFTMLYCYVLLSLFGEGKINFTLFWRARLYLQKVWPFFGFVLSRTTNSKQSQQVSFFSGRQVAATACRPPLSNKLVEIFFFRKMILSLGRLESTEYYKHVLRLKSTEVFFFSEKHTKFGKISVIAQLNQTSTSPDLPNGQPCTMTIPFFARKYLAMNLRMILKNATYHYLCWNYAPKAKDW